MLARIDPVVGLLRLHDRHGPVSQGANPMSETMLAVVTHGPRDYRVEEVPVPEPGQGELVIEVGAVGICASDMKCWLGGPLFWGEDGTGGYVEGPVIAGHEYAGHVVALGG